MRISDWSSDVCSADLISLVAFSFRTWSALSSDRSHPQFSIAALRDVRNFAAGMVLINLLVLLSNQTAKIILSGLVSLTDFGYYVLSTTGSRFIYILTTIVRASCMDSVCNYV